LASIGVNDCLGALIYPGRPANSIGGTPDVELFLSVMGLIGDDDVIPE
jgi:hypothetical protein